MATKLPAGVPQLPRRLGPALFSTPSWTRVGVSFTQDLAEGSCSCEAGEHGRRCKHLENAYLASFMLQLEIARDLAPDLLHRALDHYRPSGFAGGHPRPDIYAACLLALWEKETNDGSPLDFRAPEEWPRDPNPPSRIPMTAAAVGD